MLCTGCYSRSIDLLCMRRDECFLPIPHIIVVNTYFFAILDFTRFSFFFPLRQQKRVTTLTATTLSAPALTHGAPSPEFIWNLPHQKTKHRGIPSCCCPYTRKHAQTMPKSASQWVSLVGCSSHFTRESTNAEVRLTKEVSVAGCSSPFMWLDDHLTGSRAWCMRCLPGR